jgi:RNA polymerase sigma-70 factor (ECF subfamily)
MISRSIAGVQVGAETRMTASEDRSFQAQALPHLPTVYRIARRLAGDDHEAEDLVQETYLKACKSFRTFSPRSYGIRPWLLRILYNSHLNRQVQRERRPYLADQRTLEQHERSTPVADSRAGLGSGELNYENLDEEVKHALEKLPSASRMVLLLWASHDMSYNEIAAVLDVPVGTVMSRLSRARSQLLVSLKAYAREHRRKKNGPSEV